MMPYKIWQFAAGLKPGFTMGGGFQSLMEEHKDEKQLLAARLISEGLINKGETVFLPDGSTAMYIFLALREAKHEGGIFTTNVAICMEYIRHPGRIRDLYAVGGRVERKFSSCMYDEDHKHFLREALEKSDQVVMSASAVEFEKGPGSHNPTSAHAWKTILGAAREMIILLDHRKLGIKMPPPMVALHGPDQGEFWKNKWVDKKIGAPFLRVITNVEPGIPSDEKGQPARLRHLPDGKPDDMSPAKRYVLNAHRFSQLLGDRFIENDFVRDYQAALRKAQLKGDRNFPRFRFCQCGDEDGRW